MAGSEYYGDVTVGGRTLNDVTPEEWDVASKKVMDRGHEITDQDYDIPYNYPEDVKLTLDDISWGDINFTPDLSPRIKYKFREDELLRDLQLYIDKTYSQHYSGGKIQATEDIIDDGHGTGFCIGNAKKYLKRYGKKGETPAEWRKDIIKVLHYGLIQLYVHDLEHGNTSN